MGAHQSTPSSRKRLIKRSAGDAGAPSRSASLPTADGHDVTSTRTYAKARQASLPVRTSSPLVGPPSASQAEPHRQISALEAHNARHREVNKVVDSQTGERHDFTDIWHSLAHKASADSLDDIVEEEQYDNEGRRAGEADVAKLSRELWQLVATFLEPDEAANLALASRTLFDRLGDAPFRLLDDPDNYTRRIAFLQGFDSALPAHLLCFNCARYHLRTHPGEERLKPALVLNPLVDCPRATDPTVIIPRARIAPGHALPFSFVRLATRAQRHGDAFGVAASTLGRRWRDEASGWTHTTTFHVQARTGHLLMRVASSAVAEAELPPAGMRHLLFDKADYTPHFSVCAHWRDGELVPLAKCALQHVPGAGANVWHRMADRAKGELAQGIVGTVKAVGVGAGTGPAGQCALCKPLRRCPECPTEYLIELRLVEERKPRESDMEGWPKVRRPNLPSLVHSINVTRWSDLGDGRNPYRGEWAACTGLEGAEPYDSFTKVGGRTVSGTFEARYGDSQMGQRVLSLNPSGEKKGEKGHRWY